MLIISLFINILQMLISFLHMAKSLLNIKVNPINQRPLMDNQLIQLSIHRCQLINWFHQLLYPHVFLVLFTHLFLCNEHLKVPTAFHSLLLLGVELDGVVDRSLLVGF